MKQSITIIGKNSKLFNLLKNDLLKIFDIIEELSHKDICSKKHIINPIVFSFSNKNLKENEFFLNQLKEKCKGLLIYISTSAVLANHNSNYKYPTLKKEIENYLLDYQNIKIIRVGVINELLGKSKIVGKVKLSSKKSIIDAIIKSFEKDSLLIINSWFQTKINGSFILNIFLKFEILLFTIFKKYFILTRPFDLIFKILGFSNYGYTFLSNYYENNNNYKNIIIGNGISAAGVCQAILDHNIETPQTLLIDSKNVISTIKVKDNNEIERIGKGGNSSLWHGVISLPPLYKLNLNIIKNFKLLFQNLYYNEDFSLLEKGYSFIPLKPFRPDFSNKINYKSDFITRIKLTKNGIVLYGFLDEYFCKKTYICSGSISTLNLLKKSYLIENNKILLDDHMVGYFGQIDLNKNEIKKFNKIVRNRKGHFKRFHTIKLDNEMSLYINLRPAYFNFKKIEVAAKYRSFFGQSSSNIIFKLLTKFNLALILEALYNKFGILFPTSTYNLTGHIEIDDAILLNYNKNHFDVKYLLDHITFSIADKEKITNYFKKDVYFPEKILLSPGIHFLNAKDALSKDIIKTNPSKDLKIYSTTLINGKGPEHPSFFLYALSYTDTLLENEI